MFSVLAQNYYVLSGEMTGSEHRVPNCWRLQTVTLLKSHSLYEDEDGTGCRNVTIPGQLEAGDTPSAPRPLPEKPARVPAVREKVTVLKHTARRYVAAGHSGGAWRALQAA